MYKLDIASSALEDLETIYEYIADELMDRKAAENFLSEVEKCYDFLILQPFMYEQCRDTRLRLAGYRRAVIKRYIMVYRVDVSRNTVYILRFFYGTRDYEKLL